MRIVSRREIRPEVVALIDKCPEGTVLQDSVKSGLEFRVDKRGGTYVSGIRDGLAIEWIQVVEEGVS